MERKNETFAMPRSFKAQNTSPSRPGTAQGDDALLLIAVDGDTVYQLMTITADERSGSVFLTSLAPLFSNGGSDAWENASSFFRAGGAPLLMAAASQRLGWDLSRYILFTSEGIIKMIDFFGGLRMWIRPVVIDPLNEEIDALCQRLDMPADMYLLPETGGRLFRLDGIRTAAFLKLPETRRAGLFRVQLVLSALKTPLRNASVREFSSLLDTVMPFVRTNIPRAVLLTQLPGIRRYLQFSLQIRSLPA